MAIRKIILYHVCLFFYLLFFNLELSAQNEFYLPSRPNNPDQSQVKNTKAKKQTTYKIGFRPEFISTRFSSRERLQDSITTPRVNKPGGYITFQIDIKNAVNLFVELGLIQKTATLQAPFGRDTSIRFEFKQMYLSLPFGIRYDWRSDQADKFHLYSLLGIQINYLLDGSLWIRFPDQDKFQSIVFNNQSEFSQTELNAFFGLGLDIALGPKWKVGLEGRLNVLSTSFDNGISKRVFTNGISMINSTFSIGLNTRFHLN